jgi:O-antigen/teichoic acid export membrane protein
VNPREGLVATQTKKIALDTFALIFGRVVGLFLGMIRLNYLATYLGVGNFGILNFAAYFTSLFQTLFDLGLSQILVREMSRTPSRSNALLGNVVLLKVLIVAVASTLVLAAALVSGFDPTTTWAIILSTAGMAINGIAQAFQGAFQAQRKMVFVSLVSVANDVLLSIAVILLLPRIPEVRTPLVLAAAASLIMLGILVVVYRHSLGSPRLSADTGLWKTLLRDGLPIALGGFGISTYMFVGPTILNYTRSGTEMGIYSAGYKLISILTLIPVAFTQILFPIFSDFGANAPHKLHKALYDALRVIGQLSFPLAVGTILLAPEIIAILYPPAFSDAALVLQILIVGAAVGYLSWILQSFLLSQNHQKFCMWNSLAIAALVLAANLLLTPRLGYRAMTVISACTELLIFASLQVYTARVGFPPKHLFVFAKILLAVCVMGAVIFLFKPWGLFPNIALGIVVYVTMLLVLKVYGDQEKEILSKVLNRVFAIVDSRTTGNRDDR